MVTITQLESTIAGAFNGFDGKSQYLGAYDSEIYFLSYGKYLTRWNLETGKVSYAALDTVPGQTTTNFPFTVCAKPQKVKGGYIEFWATYIKLSETSGSRNLYQKRFKIDPVNMTLVSTGTEYSFGNANLISDGYMSLLLYDNILITGDHENGYLQVVDLQSRTVNKIGAFGAEVLCPMFPLIDRTTKKPYILFGEHYWIVGGYSRLQLVDISAWTSTQITSYDAGSGQFEFNKSYLDLTEKTHMLATGGTHGAALGGSYGSKWHSFYLNNGTLSTAWAPFVAGATYNSANCSNRFPYVLGKKTGESKLMLITYAAPYGNVGATQYGVSYCEVDTGLANPTNKTESIWTLPTGGQCWHAQTRGENLPWVFLSEHDWNYYLPLGVWNGTAAKLAKIEGVPDVDWFDPYNVVFVPQGGCETIPSSIEDSQFKTVLDTFRRGFKGNPSFEVTRSKLKLGGRDTTTGWYDKYYRASKINMLIIQKEAQTLALQLGHWVSLDALGLTATQVEVYDLVKDEFGRTWEIKTVKPIVVGNTIKYFACDLKELPLHA